MSDKEKEPLKKGEEGKAGEEGKDGEEKKDERGFCEKCWGAICEVVMTVCRTIYNTLSFIFNTIRSVLAFIWYPIKERCLACCQSCDRRLNPYRDPSYSNV
eukprot:TRINITY_DN4943_c0_g1_i4.p2 TRINITY_DN4943_c0_g1~~TRINITY_DN4943_c0_g1_i4.p2  ORF type:complete len:101 (+),score=16.55 TRINITY_DN4943_c0_g1_i4:298-600(+)